MTIMRGFAALLCAGIGLAAPTAVAQEIDSEAIVRACIPPADRERPWDAMPAQQRSTIMACLQREAARQLNPQLPMRVDEITVLRSVSTVGGRLTYHSEVEVDARNISAAQQAGLYESTRSYVCGVEAMRNTIQFGGSYGYVWQDRAGQPIGEVVIDRC